MVIIGGITRLTGSGLSIVEWKPITGIIPPLSDEDWAAEFAKYKLFPQYQLLNTQMTLTEFKEIFFWEYIHRLLGRVIGVVFLAPFLFFYAKGWISPRLRLRLLIIFLLGGVQGFMGWYMVKSGLQHLPHVSHFRLAVHQGLALLVIAYIFWTVLSLEKEKRWTIPSPRLLTATILALLALACQITLGAFVAGLKAGYSYTNFPWMGESFLPDQALRSARTYFYNGALLQFTHRWLAFLVLAGFMLLYYLSKSHSELRSYGKQLLLVSGVQIVLGIGTLLLHMPISLAVAHQFVAILLLLILLTFLHAQFYKPRSLQSHALPHP